MYPALDAKVKNVTLHYSSEHADEVISTCFSLFDVTFQSHLFVELMSLLLSLFESVPSSTSGFHPLSCKMEEVRTTIERHLAKEEEQLIPLLIKLFSFTEQASMIAQFLFCIPMTAVQNFTDWIFTSDRQDLIVHVKTAVSDELLLSLLMSWLDPEVQSPQSMIQEGIKVLEGSIPNNRIPLDEDRAPLRQIANFHRSIFHSLDAFISEAKSISNSEIAGSRMDPLLAKHRFLKDVCRFHMLSEEEIMFPVLFQYAHSASDYDLCHAEHTAEGVWFDDLGRLLTDARSTARRGSMEAKDLLNQAISYAEDLRSNLWSHMLREEQEVFPVLQENLGSIEQCLMVWKTIKMMPLRLLERVMPWIASQLSESEYKGLLTALEIGGKHFQESAVLKLLSRLVQQGSNKKQNSKFRGKRSRPESCNGEDLTKQDFQEQDFQKQDSEEQDLRKRNSQKQDLQNQNSGKQDLQERNSPKQNLQNQSSEKQYLQNQNSGEQDSKNRILIPTQKSNPVDHIFQFHRAMIRDFRLFESETSELVKTLETGSDSRQTLLQSLKGRFNFLWSLYEAHSKAEDDVMFPVLESKEATSNSCHSYMLDHQREEESFAETKQMIEDLTQISSLQEALNSAVKLNRKCAAMRSLLEIHVRAEETELWPFFAEHFTIEEQQKIVGQVIGRTGAEVLQMMIPWISSVFTQAEQDAMNESLHEATKNTKFEAWMKNWQNSELQRSIPMPSTDDQGLKEVVEYLKSREFSTSKEFTPSFEDIFRMNQAQLQDAVRQVSNDQTLEPRRKAYLIQHMLASQYIISQQSKVEEAPTDVQHFRSFAQEGVLGCPHYQRNCALVAPCCDNVYVCRLCHDEEQTHKLDRQTVTEIVCMECGTRQEISNSCISCKVQFGHYYCRICRLYENQEGKDIYHCPFCNVCRRGKGLGIDFYHCMECNACMHTSLFNKHKCRRQKMDCTCPICGDSLFDSSTPIRVIL